MLVVASVVEAAPGREQVSRGDSESDKSCHNGASYSGKPASDHRMDFRPGANVIKLFTAVIYEFL